LEGMKQLLEKTKLTAAMLEKIVASQANDQRLTTNDFSSAVGQSFAQLIKRPEIVLEHLVTILRGLAPDFFMSAGCNVLPDDGSQPALSGAKEPRTEDVLANAQRPTSLSSRERNDLKSVETEIKYAGYLTQQQRSIDRLKRAEQRSIPDWFDYRAVSGLSREMQEKLLKIRPRTLGHAARIPGVTPAAISLVNVYIELQSRRREQAAAL